MTIHPNWFLRDAAAIEKAADHWPQWKRDQVGLPPLKSHEPCPCPACPWYEHGHATKPRLGD